MNKRKVIGVILVLVASIFCHIETVYFGNNWMPQSNAEVWCDLISLGVWFAGMVLFFTKLKQQA